MFIGLWTGKNIQPWQTGGRNSLPTSNLTAWGSYILKSKGFCKLYAAKQTCFYVLKSKKKQKTSEAMQSQRPTVARTPGHNDNVMTSPAAVPRILRENQKMKLKYSM